VNVFSAAERLAAVTRSTVRLNRDRCLYASDRFATCTACQDLCPVTSIQASHPPELDEAACANCLACLPVCPVGAFAADDAVADLLECAARAETHSFELICEKHPQPGQGPDPDALGLRVRGCLAGLGAGAYLALVALGAERVVARADACADCAWAALQPRIETQAHQAQQLLNGWGRAETVAVQRQPLETSVPRVAWDTQNPPISRRDLFRRLSHQGQVVAARAWASGEAEVANHTPGRDHRRTARAAAFFATAAAGQALAPTPLLGSDWAVISASDACTACGACARTCPTGALHLEHPAGNTFALTFAALDCVGCEACVRVCAPAALTVNHTPPFEQVFGGATQTLCSGELAHCERCGAEMAARPGATLCAVCAQRVRNPFGQQLPPGLRGAGRRPEVRP
jgi:ferredoxin